MGYLSAFEFFHVAGSFFVKNSRYSSSKIHTSVSAKCLVNLGLAPSTLYLSFLIYKYIHLLGGLYDIHQYKNAVKKPKVDPININPVITVFLFPVSPPAGPPAQASPNSPLRPEWREKELLSPLGLAWLGQ